MLGASTNGPYAEGAAIMTSDSEKLRQLVHESNWLTETTNNKSNRKMEAARGLNKVQRPLELRVDSDTPNEGENNPEWDD